MKKLVRKPSAMKKATILSREDKGNGRVEYTVLSSDGKTKYIVVSINFIVDSCECPGHALGGHACYHMRDCQIMEENLRTYDVVAEAAKVVANAEAELDAAMYDELATTKKVSVPPAEYDSCKQCGCRIAVGASYCKRC